MSKSPTHEKYKGLEPIRLCNVIYYHTKAGLWVFKPMPTGGLAVYTGHFFQRYNERLGLGLSNPLDLVRRFFAHSGFSEHIVTEEGARAYSIGTCREGLLPGEMQFDTLWLVNKTFISRDLIRTDQSKAETEMTTGLQREVERELMRQHSNENLTNYKAEVAKCLTTYRTD